MKPYIHFIEDGEDFILQRGHPYFVGKITDNKPIDNYYFPIPGYFLYVSINGNIMGNYAPSVRYSSEEMTNITSSMSNWAINYIVKDNSKYEKYKVDDTSTNE
jgi:hypothetical protein